MAEYIEGKRAVLEAFKTNVPQRVSMSLKAAMAIRM